MQFERILLPIFVDADMNVGLFPDTDAHTDPGKMPEQPAYPANFTAFTPAASPSSLQESLDAPSHFYFGPCNLNSNDCTNL